MLFDPSRDQVRRFFLDVWRKTQTQVPMSPMELMAQEWMLLHPEYHGLFADEDKAMTKDFSVEDGQTNPFLPYFLDNRTYNLSITQNIKEHIILQLYSNQSEHRNKLNCY